MLTQSIHSYLKVSFVDCKYFVPTWGMSTYIPNNLEDYARPCNDLYILEAFLLHLILPLILRLIDVPPNIFAQPINV